MALTPEILNGLSEPIIEQVDAPTVRGTMAQADLVAACREFLHPETSSEYTDEQIFRCLQEAAVSGARTNLEMVVTIAQRMNKSRLARSVGVKMNDDPRDVGSRPAPAGIAAHIGDLTARPKAR